MMKQMMILARKTMTSTTKSGMILTCRGFTLTAIPTRGRSRRGWSKA